MAKSWGHGIASASTEEREMYQGCEGKCTNPVVFRLRYNYVTGRRGRVGLRERYVCEDHGRKFAEKYSIAEIPDPNVAGEGSRARGLRRAVIGDVAKAFSGERN